MAFYSFRPPSVCGILLLGCSVDALEKSYAAFIRIFWAVHQSEKTGYFELDSACIGKVFAEYRIEVLFGQIDLTYVLGVGVGSQTLLVAFGDGPAEARWVGVALDDEGFQRLPVRSRSISRWT